MKALVPVFLKLRTYNIFLHLHFFIFKSRSKAKMINFVIFKKLFPHGIYMKYQSSYRSRSNKYDLGKVCCTPAVLCPKVGQRSYFGIFEKFFPQGNGIHI